MDARIEVEAGNIAAGIVRLKDIRVEPAPEELIKRVDERISELNGPFADEEAVRKSVRSLLRFGRYKPSGRGKPASEYLLESAREGSFPAINNVVDALNYVSLGSMLPISLIDTEKAGGVSFMLRRGREGESYIFNRSGQALDLQDLLLVSVLPEDEPLATPVKDCQKTKVDENTVEALAVIYAPGELSARLSAAAEELGREMSAFARVETMVLAGK